DRPDWREFDQRPIEEDESVENWSPPFGWQEETFEREMGARESRWIDQAGSAMRKAIAHLAAEANVLPDGALSREELVEAARRLRMVAATIEAKAPRRMPSTSVARIRGAVEAAEEEGSRP
ncbi:MAG TPA: hypothetical protein VKS25_05260, partial [Solirubrobacteraceae bacterium]|nr:hypothetical protein [Solirubrobacteraceae bacterium]